MKRKWTASQIRYRQNERLRTSALIAERDKAAWSRPGRGSKNDLFRPDDGKQAAAYDVEDVRKGVTFCMKCRAEVTHVRLGEGERWQTRDLDNTPHIFTCTKESK